MTIKFERAVRENVNLLIGLIGGTGSGKTYSAMRMAKGISGEKPFAVIDTEASRAKHYADFFKFDHGDMHPPFSPLAFMEAIAAADKEGYPVILVDNMSHEHAGDGGLLDIQEAELNRMAGNDYAKRERVKMASWIKPKMEHKKMVQRLLQVRAHLILCFRAEEKVEMRKNAQGKMEIVKKQTLTGIDGWVPISEKNLPYELTVSFLLLASNKGVPVPIKLQEQHKHLFPPGNVITEESGRLIAEWASGGKPRTTATAKAKQPDPVPDEAPIGEEPPPIDDDDEIKDTYTSEQRKQLIEMIKGEGVDVAGIARFRSFYLDLMGSPVFTEDLADFLIKNFHNVYFIWKMIEMKKINAKEFRIFYLEFIQEDQLLDQTVTDLKDNLETIIEAFDGR